MEEFKSTTCLPSAVVMLRALAAVLGLVSAWLAFDRFVLARPIERGPGIIAPQVPVQEALDPDEALQFTKAGFALRALASFELEARVLGVESYCCWGGDSLVPVDVAFGWGRMSDEEVLSRLEITQGGRFYFWRYEGSPPIPRQEIVTSSANMHLIAATPAIAKAIGRLRPGHLVRLSGYLVEARDDGGFHWRSSLTRADSGNGACELVWVEELSVQ